MDHEADHGFGHLGHLLAILGQAPPRADPAACPFNHSPAWQHDKAFGARDAADDEQCQTEQEAGEQGCYAVVDAVGEHTPEPAAERLDAPEQVACAVRVLDGGDMHEHAKQQPLGVHRDVVSGFAFRNRGLAPIDLLGRIVAARTVAFPRKPLRGFAVVFMLCVSMPGEPLGSTMAALGLGSRTTPSRSMTTR